MRLIRTIFLFSVLISFIGCSEESTNFRNPSTVQIDLKISYPPDNLPDSAKIILGEKLFFDVRLSKNKNIACASCHKPELAFADSTAISIGTNGDFGFRNAPSIINAAFKPHLHADGGIENLELQTLAPLTDPQEMANDYHSVLQFLNSDSDYVSLFKAAFDSIPTIYGFTRALANYERTLIQGSSKYDAYVNGDSNSLSDSQKRGLALFESDRLNCISCHSGKLLTDYSIHNIGLEFNPLDSGRARITGLAEDRNKFVTPSLKNISLTAPYMHNGSLKTLYEVVTFLESGGHDFPNKSIQLKPFKLTKQERKDLLHFFEALTDETIKH